MKNEFNSAKGDGHSPEPCRFRHGRRGAAGFSLLEVMVATTITVTMLFVIARLTTATLDTIGRTTRLLEHHDGSNRVFQLLRDDLRDLRPLDGWDTPALRLETNDDEGVVLTLVRADPHIQAVDEQGYYRHVEYAWEKEAQTLVRTVYHPVNDPGNVVRSQASSDGDNHRANLARLAALTPALADPDSWAGQEDFSRMRGVAEVTPLFEDLREFSVECHPVWNGGGGTGEDAQTTWDDPSAVPQAIMIRLSLRPSQGPEDIREFELLIPVETKLELIP